MKCEHVSCNGISLKVDIRIFNPPVGGHILQFSICNPENHKQLTTDNKQVMKREAILEYLSEQKPEFEQKFGVTKIGLFGSNARDQSRTDSDLDIVVELEKPDLLMLVGIKQMIEEDLGIEVDVVRNRERMNHTLKKRIERDAVYV